MFKTIEYYFPAKKMDKSCSKNASLFLKKTAYILSFCLESKHLHLCNNIILKTIYHNIAGKEYHRHPNRLLLGIFLCRLCQSFSDKEYVYYFDLNYSVLIYNTLITRETPASFYKNIYEYPLPLR